MLINGNYVYITTFQFNQMKTSRVTQFQPVIFVSSCTRATHSAFYAAGRSRISHLTSTRPDRQQAPVDPTGFHLWGAPWKPVATICWSI